MSQISRHTWKIIGCIWLLGGCHNHAKEELAKVSLKNLDGARKAEEFHRLGVQFLAEGKLADAQQAFESAIAQDTGFGPAHNNLGKIYLKRQQLYQAAWEFEAASKVMPTRPEPENNLAMVYERAGKLDLAITHYEKSHGLAPDNAEILGNLLRARLRRGDKDDSVKELLAQVVIRDTRPEWIAWAKERLAMLAGERADPSPRDSLPKSDLGNILDPFKPEDKP